MNLMAGCFKDREELLAAPLAPAVPLTAKPGWTAAQKALAGVYNRLGGLMDALAKEAQSDTAAVLALWYVESGGRAHKPGSAIIRFECNLLYSAWGAKNAAVYRRYFRHGGFEGASGKPWENHQFRTAETQPFRPVHASQASEYQALELAIRLAGETPALEAASIGGCQIVVCNYALIGYPSPRAMYDAFQADERAHVLGFFDFCARKSAPKQGDLLRYLQAKDWTKFAAYYNGAGNAAVYGGRIQTNYELARAILPAVS